MEMLNEYLKSLLSSCSDELRLEPDKNPYLVSANKSTNIGNVALKGTQISTMVFPLIPPEAKSALPNKPEIEFVHPHNLGNFNFTVQKSPAGFNVTIRPMLTEADGSVPMSHPLPAAAPPMSAETTPVATPSAPEIFSPLQTENMPAPEVSYDLESSSHGYDQTSFESVQTATVSDLIFEDKSPAQEYVPPTNEPEIEVVAVNDPEFQTVFYDSSTYEPPGRRDDLELADYVAPIPEAEATFTPPSPVIQSPAFEPPPPTYEAPPPTPAAQVAAPSAAPAAQAAFVPAAANSAEKAKMDDLFNQMAEFGASDLHLSVSMPPMIRKDGKMRPLVDGAELLGPNEMRSLVTSIMPTRNQEEFARRSDTDFAYEIPGLARFRCNIFMDRKGMGAVFRIIPSKMTTASQIGLSEAILGLCGLSKGLVVVTGRSA